MSEQGTELDTIFTVDFQRGLLKILATNTVFSASYGTLVNEEYFDSHSTQVLCRLIKDYAFTYSREMDITALFVQIEKHVEQMGLAEESADVIRQEAKIIMKTHIPSEQFYIDKLTEFARKQELKNALFKSCEILEKSQPGAYEKVLGLIDNAVSVGSGVSDEISFGDLYDLPSEYLKKYDPNKLVKFGFPTLDKAMYGGMAPGELHVILAPPKVGKSSTMVNVGATNLRMGVPVFHITCEISKEDVAMKYVNCISGMTTDQLTRMSVEAYQHKIKKYEQFKPNLYINFWPEGTASTLQIRSWISRVRSKTGVTPGLIIIDYDDCLIPTTGKSRDDMYNDAGQIYSDMIQLASYFQCPVLTAAQPQRDSWEAAEQAKLITHDKLAHSAKKAHKCWSITSLNFANESNDGIAYLDIARRGVSKTKIKINKDLGRCRVKEAGT